jgi:hypothetical protein
MQMPLINHTQLHGITLRVFEAAGSHPDEARPSPTI